MEERCYECKNQKEVWRKVEEEGAAFMMFDHTYCPLEECRYEKKEDE